MAQSRNLWRRCDRCAYRSKSKAGQPCDGGTHPDCHGRIKWGFTIDVTPQGVQKRQRYSRSGFDTKDEAVDAAKALEHEVGRPGYGKSPNKTMREWFVEWLELREGLAAAGRLRGSTVRENRRHIQDYIDQRIGHVRLIDLSRSDVKRMANDLLQQGGKNGSPLSAGTVANAIRTLSRSLSDALDDEFVTHNVANNTFSMSASQRTTAKAWDLDDTRRFLAYTAEDNFYAAWRLYLATGMRRGEVAGLDWGHIDFKMGKLKVEQAWVVGDNNRLTMEKPKTAAGKRTLTLDPKTLEALSDYRQAIRDQRRVLGMSELIPKDEPVFLGLRSGVRVDPRYLSKRWRRLVSQAGLPSIPLHGARHSIASQMIAARIPLTGVQGRLGHGSLTTTTSIYSHVLNGLEEEVAEVVTSILDGTAG